MYSSTIEWWPRPGIMVILWEVPSMLVHLMHIEELEQSGLSAPLESALVWTHVGSIEDCLGFLLFHVEGTHHLLDRSFVMRTVIVVIRPSSPCISLSLRRDYASVYRIQSGATGRTGRSRASGPRNATTYTTPRSPASARAPPGPARRRRRARRATSQSRRPPPAGSPRRWRAR